MNPVPLLLIIVTLPLLLGGCGEKKAVDEFHGAVQSGQKDKTLLLIKNGADVNSIINSGGWTPLHRAANYGHTEITKLLIDAGANLNAKIKIGVGAGSTPLGRAIHRNHPNIVKLLIDAGVDANRENALHHAAAKGHKEIAEIIINAGADVNEQNANTITPLHLVASNGHWLSLIHI